MAVHIHSAARFSADRAHGSQRKTEAVPIRSRLRRWRRPRRDLPENLLTVGLQCPEWLQWYVLCLRANRNRQDIHHGSAQQYWRAQPGNYSAVSGLHSQNTQGAGRGWNAVWVESSFEFLLDLSGPDLRSPESSRRKEFANQRRKRRRNICGEPGWSAHRHRGTSCQHYKCRNAVSWDGIPKDERNIEQKSHGASHWRLLKQVVPRAVNRCPWRSWTGLGKTRARRPGRKRKSQENHIERPETWRSQAHQRKSQHLGKRHSMSRTEP